MENNQIGAWAFAGKANTDKSLDSGRAILLIVFKQPGANVIQTVDRIKAALPALQANIPPGIAVHVISDRTQTIRASVRDVEITLLITVALVVPVIFVFLLNVRATLIPSVVIPISLLSTAGVMLALHYSLDIVHFGGGGDAHAGQAENDGGAPGDPGEHCFLGEQQGHGSDDDADFRASWANSKRLAVFS